jgi:hypothetical protein
MARLWSVKFRGDEWEAVVDGKIGSEGPTDWHFYGIDAAAHGALAITDAEDDSIVHQLREAWLDNAMNAYDEDAR